MNRFCYFWIRNKDTGKVTIVKVEPNGETWFFGNDQTYAWEEIAEEYEMLGEIEKPKDAR